MSADLHKLRDSRLFRKLPDRAFDKVLKHIRVRSFERGEEILRPSSSGELSKFFGYVVTGRAIFLTKENKPVGMSFSDEIFLGRSFSIEEQSVHRIISAYEGTLIVFIPREIIESLTSASKTFSDIIEDIYDSIFERAELIATDTKGAEHFEQWLKSDDSTKALTSWLGELEKKKKAAAENKKKD